MKGGHESIDDGSRNTLSSINEDIQIETVSDYNDSDEPQEEAEGQERQQLKKKSWFKVIQQPQSRGPSNDDDVASCKLKHLDLTTSTDWMEYIEHTENRFYDEGGAGAYDTMRCDVLLKPTSRKDNNNDSNLIYYHPSSFDIWGETFHLNRLLNSYLTLVNGDEGDQGTGSHRHQHRNLSKMTEIALDESKSIIQRLLQEAMLSLPTTSTFCTKFTTNDKVEETKPASTSSTSASTSTTPHPPTTTTTTETESVPSSISNVQKLLKNDDLIYLVRLTLLWSPPSSTSISSNRMSQDEMHDDKEGEQGKNRTDNSCDDGDDGQRIIVRGHACCSCKAVTLHASPEPIVVTIAAHCSKHDEINKKKKLAAAAADSVAENTSIDESLPTRYEGNPQTKIASWCRLRRQMERPETYKPQGVSEVLMVRDHGFNEDEQNIHEHHHSHSPTLEVLEGLSSNFFVIYDDGTIRTASDGVLHGYVRHLVLQHAEECGLVFDPTKPVLLNDAARHKSQLQRGEEESQWKEAFITSSSRLIIPISRILIPIDNESDGHNGNEPGKDRTLEEERKQRVAAPSVIEESEIPDGFTEVWRDPVLLSRKDDTRTASNNQNMPKWQELLNKLLMD